MKDSSFYFAKKLIKSENHKKILETKSVVFEDVNFAYENLIVNLPFDLFDSFHEYCDFLIKHVLEINKEKTNKMCQESFKNGVEFERYLRNKHEKNEQ